MFSIQVLEYCSDGAWYYDQATKTNRSVPDGTTAFFNDASEYVSTLDIIDTFNAYCHMDAHGFSGSVGFKIPCNSSSSCFSGSASFNHEAGAVNMALKENLNVSTFAHYWLGMHNLTYNAPPFVRPLYKAFEESVAYLPASLKSDEDLARYVEIAEFYGTSAPDEITLGGSVTVMTTLDKAFYGSVTAKWAFTQFALAFDWSFIDLGVSGFTNRSQIHINETFTAHAKNETFFRGGDPQYEHQDGLELGLWRGSIASNLAYVDVAVSPITLSFPPTAGTKSANYAKVINYYLAKGKWPTSPPALEAYRPMRSVVPQTAEELKDQLPLYAQWIDEHPREVQAHLTASRAHFDAVPRDVMQTLFVDV